MGGLSSKGSGYAPPRTITRHDQHKCRHSYHSQADIETAVYPTPADSATPTRAVDPTPRHFLTGPRSSPHAHFIPRAASTTQRQSDSCISGMHALDPLGGSVGRRARETELLSFQLNSLLSRPPLSLGLSLSRQRYGNRISRFVSSRWEGRCYEGGTIDEC